MYTGGRGYIKKLNPLFENRKFIIIKNCKNWLIVIQKAIEIYFKCTALKLSDTSNQFSPTNIKHLQKKLKKKLL